MGNRRSAVEFAFGNFDVQSGFAVSHQYDREPGIVRPGVPVTLRAETVRGYSEVTAYWIIGSGPFAPEEIRRDGEPAHFYRSAGSWIATLPEVEDEVSIHYIVEARHDSGACHYADGRLPLAHAKVFAHRATRRTPPVWAQRAVVYQIFVDRFATGDGPITEMRDIEDWAGGDLHGVTSHLEWIQGLGVDTIWLTPIFECSSYHGYDTKSFTKVDERFGGDEALRTLVQEAHARDMRVLLDLVPNHISSDHPWFLEALAGGPKRAWFTFHADGGYDTFMGVESMPKVNLDHAEARRAMIDAAAHWVRDFDIDGYRIDHALGPSESFFAALTTELEAIKPEIWLFGEVTATPRLCRRYGGVLDGVTDFSFAYAMREFYAGRIEAFNFAEIERESIAALPADEFTWVRFFDNHDMARGLQVWGQSMDAHASAVDALLSMRGVPSIFYGTEAGLTHEEGEATGGLSVGRVPMRFDAGSSSLPHVRAAIARRRGAAVDQADPVIWDPTFDAWRWGELEGRLSPE